MNCLAAYTGHTPDTGYAGFVNAYELEDGQVQITVREQAENPALAVIKMSPKAFAEFVADMAIDGSPALFVSIYEAIGKRAGTKARDLGIVR